MNIHFSCLVDYISKFNIVIVTFRKVNIFSLKAGEVYYLWLDFSFIDLERVPVKRATKNIGI